MTCLGPWTGYIGPFSLAPTRSGRVMIITGKGETVYTGHPAVNNTGHPFTPGDLEVTKSDNIIVTDTQNHTLHILDSDTVIFSWISLYMG
jgi:hypothetical protein